MNSSQTDAEADILARARTMVPALRERATRAESLRRMPPETVAAFREAGFYRLLQPRRFGGLELDFGAQTMLAIELAQGCASSAWDASITACHAWMAGMFPPEAQDDIWGSDANATISTCFMCEGMELKPDGDGFRVSGRGKFSSGVDHCDWVILVLPGPPASPGGPPDALFGLFPLSECRVEDVWHTIGLSATGSNDVVLEDVALPPHRILRIMSLMGNDTPGSAVNPSYQFRLPLFAVFSYNLVGTAIGAAKGAAADIVAAIRGQTAVTSVRIAERQGVQLRVAESLAEIDAAMALVLRNRDEIIAMARAGEIPDLESRTRYRRDNGFATLMCVRAVDRLYPLRGGRGLAVGDPVQRAWRDIHAVSHHIALSWDVQAEQNGAVVLGLPCPDPRT